jgi:hypothetical protein
MAVPFFEHAADEPPRNFRLHGDGGRSIGISKALSREDSSRFFMARVLLRQREFRPPAYRWGKISTERRFEENFLGFMAAGVPASAASGFS